MIRVLSVVSMFIALFMCIILLLTVANVEGVDPVNVLTKSQQLQIEALFTKRDSIATYLDSINSDLYEATTSRDLAAQLSFASDTTGKEYISHMDGMISQEVDQLATSFSTQYQELVNYTNTLLLKQKVVQESIKILDNQIIEQYNNGVRMNRFASTEMGTVTLLANNTLVYIGRFETTYKNAGFASSGATSRIIKTGFVDMSAIAGKKVVDLQAVANYNFVILTNDGQVWSWGYNYLNTLGANTAGAFITMKQPDFGIFTTIPVIKRIKCADSFYGCYMIASDGRLIFMGPFDYTATTETNWVRPKLLSTSIDGLTHGAVDVALSSLSSLPKSICFISNINNLVYCTGDNSQGQLGDTSTTSRIPTASPSTSTSPPLVWKQVSSDVKFVKIQGGSQYFMALSTEGKLYSWGSSDFRLGRDTKIVPYFVPGKVPTPFMIRNFCIAPSKTSTFVTDFQDNVYVIGSYFGEDIPQFYKIAGLGERTFSEIVCGDSGTFLIPTSSSAAVWATGKNTNYQLGSDIVTTYLNFFESSAIPRPYAV